MFYWDQLFLVAVFFFRVLYIRENPFSVGLVDRSLRKQPSFFAPGPSGVSLEGNATRAGSEEGRLFSQARLIDFFNVPVSKQVDTVEKALK